MQASRVKANWRTFFRREPGSGFQFSAGIRKRTFACAFPENLKLKPSSRLAAAALLELLARAAGAEGVATGGLDVEARLALGKVQLQHRALRGWQALGVDVSGAAGGGDVVVANRALIRTVQFLRHGLELAEVGFEVRGRA